MPPYNTGNPIGSTDARDLSDNAQNLDQAVNSSGSVWTDRLGNARPTWNAVAQYAGPAYDASTYGGLEAALTELGAGPATLQYGTGQTFTQNWEIPEGIELLPLNGAVINHGAYTISYAGSTERWPLAQVFSGTGLVTLGKGSSRVIAQWFGATGDGSITNEEVYFNRAFATAAASALSVEVVPGVYKVSGATTTRVPFFGRGGSGRTRFYPQGAFAVFDVERCTRGDIGGITIDYSQIPGGTASVTSSCIGIRLMNSATTKGEQIDFTAFRDIIIRYGWHGIRYDASAAPETKGQLYMVSFEHVHVEYCQGRGIHLYTTTGTLSVSLKHCSVDAPRPSDGFYGAYKDTSTGFYFYNIANLTLHQCLASAIQATSPGKVAAFLSCHGIDLTSFQHELTNMTAGGAESGPIAFYACEDVQLDVRSQNITVNTGGSNIAPFVYFDAQMESAVIKSMAEQVVTVTSGVKKHFTINEAAEGAVNIMVLDGSMQRANCNIPDDQQAKIRFASEDYALTNNRNTVRSLALAATTVVATATKILAIAAYGSFPHPISGLYVVTGSQSSDSTLGFVDLILVGTPTGGTQSVVAVSSNNMGGFANARTYSATATELRVSIPVAACKVSVTGFSMTGAF